MTAFGVRKIGPLKIKWKTSKVAFEIGLPEHIKIHTVISCIHFERCQPAPPLIIEGE